MNRTKIEWCLNPDGTPGYTWNPITGCLKGCSYCYARNLANGRLKSRMLENAYGLPKHQGIMKGSYPTRTPFYPRFWHHRLEDVSPLDKPRGIFVCSMGDLFGQGVPEKWTADVMETIQEAPQHRFYLLTKQPQNLARWSPFPDNCWVGVSATDRDSWGKANEYLSDIQATVKYISFEPLLGDVVGQPNTVFATEAMKAAGINWIIIGAQTKPYVAPKIEWVREIVEAADNAGVPVFLKDSLKPLLVISRSDQRYAPGWANGGTGTLRQEMPAINKS